MSCQSYRGDWRRDLTEESGGFSGLELIRDLVLLLAKVKGLIAIELYFADTAAGGSDASAR